MSKGREPGQELPCVLPAYEFQTGGVSLVLVRQGSTITVRVITGTAAIHVPFHDGLPPKGMEFLRWAPLQKFIDFLQGEILDGSPKAAEQAPNPDSINLRPELRSFAEVMEVRLKATNDHKPSWTRETDAHLLDRLREELAELSRAVDDNARGKGRASWRIVTEAADVANFAMFLAERWRRVRDPRDPLVPISEQK